MADEGKGAAAPSEAAETQSTWTTGDPERDWTRYEGRFDRIDASVRHSLACLLGADGLLLAVLALALVAGSSLVQVGLDLVILPFPAIGFAISVAIFWRMYRALEYRRSLESKWEALYPRQVPTPYGARARNDSSIAFAPSPLIALVSCVAWLAQQAVWLAWCSMQPRPHIYPTERTIYMIVASGILCAIALVIALAVGAVCATSTAMDHED